MLHIDCSGRETGREAHLLWAVTHFADKGFAAPGSVPIRSRKPVAFRSIDGNLHLGL